MQQLGWSNLAQLGVGIILLAYCCSFLFDKVKTANTWFSLLNIILGVVILPMVIFG